MAVKIQFRRDTAANWAAVPTTVLSSGEVGYESDTGNIKIGDGTTQWQNLAYYQLPNVSVNPATTVDLNATAYRVMGRYRLNSVTGTPFTNAPTDIDSDANSYATMVVTTHKYAGASPETLTQQTLTQYSNSAAELKQWVRIYNGTDWTAWTSTTDITDNEVTTAKIDNLAVTTAKIADLNVTTGKIADNGVTDAKIRDSAALSVIGRSANSSGDPTDISAANDGEVLRRSGTSLGFGTLASTAFSDNTIAPQRLTNASGATVLGATGAGAISQLSAVNARTAINSACVVNGVSRSSGEATSNPGDYCYIATGSGSSFTLPSGGTWLVSYVRRISSSGAIDGSGSVFGPYSGGTVLVGQSDRVLLGGAWRMI